MKRVLVALVSTAVFLIAVNTVRAGGPHIEAGKWQFKTTLHIPLMPDPKVTTDTKCITEEEANRDPLDVMLKESECKLLSREESGDTVEFEMECMGDMDAKMRGRGKFTADGSTASGSMEMTMKMARMGGKTMKMTQEWEAKRIGDCE